MHYWDTLSSPQSCSMDIIGGGGIDTIHSSDHSSDHQDLLLHLSSYPSMNIFEVSQPWKQGECYFPVYGCPSHDVVGQGTYVSMHSVPCNSELMSRMSTWEIPNLGQDYNIPVLDIRSRSAGASWNSGLGDQYMRQYVPAAPMSLCNSSTKRSLHATIEMKRASGMVEPNDAPQLEFKKSRSNPMHRILKVPDFVKFIMTTREISLSVRKEKLGDRIAALQQLVAPYGKTDTASVLSEAIGYIKLLQDQVEALSSPYMKLSHVWTVEKSNEASIREETKDGTIEAKATELKRRGMCLVPLSCLSHINFDDYGGPIFNWSIPRGS